MPRAPFLTPTQQTAAVRRLARAYRRTTPAQARIGLGWYDEAARVASDIGPTPAVGAGVLATMSVRCQWSVTVAWSAAIIRAALQGDECPEWHTTTMRAQAWRIANGEAPLDVLNGPKVRAFYANIMGDEDAVTVDVWAIRAALGDPSHDGTVTPKQYGILAEIYRRAARACRVAPRTLQAAVWVATRGVKPTDAGFHADAERAA